MTHVVNTMGETQEVVALYVRDVPDELHTAVKVEAAIAGKSMRQLVLDALEHEVDRLKAERGETGRGRRR
jgi:plasmid stability protein